MSTTSSRLYRTFPGAVAVVTAILAATGLLYTALPAIAPIEFHLGLANPLAWPVLLLTTCVPLLFSTLSLRQAVRRAGLGGGLWSAVHVTALILTVAMTVASAILYGAASIEQALALAIALIILILDALIYGIMGVCAGLSLRRRLGGDGRMVGTFWMWSSLALILFTILLVAVFVFAITTKASLFFTASHFMLLFAMMMLTAQSFIPWAALSRPTEPDSATGSPVKTLAITAAIVVLAAAAAIAINVMQPQVQAEGDYYEDVPLDDEEIVIDDLKEMSDDSLIIEELDPEEWADDSLESVTF